MISIQIKLENIQLCIPVLIGKRGALQRISALHHCKPITRSWACGCKLILWLWKRQGWEIALLKHRQVVWQITGLTANWWGAADYLGCSAASFCTWGDSMLALLRISVWALLRLRLLEFRQSNFRRVTNHIIPGRPTSAVQDFARKQSCIRVDTDAHPHGGSCRESLGYFFSTAADTISHLPIAQLESLIYWSI